MWFATSLEIRQRYNKMVCNVVRNYSTLLQNGLPRGCKLDYNRKWFTTWLDILFDYYRMVCLYLSGVD